MRYIVFAFTIGLMVLVVTWAVKKMFTDPVIKPPPEGPKIPPDDGPV